MDNSFWSGGFDFGNTSSAIDEVLCQEDFTLEDLLEHEDVIQECKYLNSDLIDYLARPESIEKLVRYVITPPIGPDDENKMDPEEIAKMKQYAYLASELFACEVIEMLDALFENTQYLELLFSFLDQPPGIDPGCCAYFCKVIVVLIGKKHGPLAKFVVETKQLEKIVTHIGLYSVMELLIRIGWDDGGGIEELGSTPEEIDPEWLHKAELVPMLVKLLDPAYENQTGVHVNAACCLVDVVVKSSPGIPAIGLLVSDLQSEPVLADIFKYMFSGSSSCLQNTLSIASVLVQSDTELRMQNESQFDEMGMTEIEEKKSPEKLSPILNYVLKSLPKLMDYLYKPPDLDGFQLKTQYGKLSPPFGPTRLKIVELMLALITCEVIEVNEALVEAKVLIGVFDMFFSYHWNNMLHGLVESMIHTVLDDNEYENDEDEMDRAKMRSLSAEIYLILKKNMFGEASLMKRIIGAFDANSENIKGEKDGRLGFMGHMIRICASISRYSDDTLMSWNMPKEDIEAWHQLREGRLKDDIDEQQKVLGGHRPGGFEEEEEEDEGVELHDISDMVLEEQGDIAFLDNSGIYDDDQFYDWENDDGDDITGGVGGTNSSDEDDDGGLMTYNDDDDQFSAGIDSTELE